MTSTQAGIPKHSFGRGFDQAVATAREGLEIKAQIVKPEYMDGYSIVRYTSPSSGKHTFHAYNQTAWERPETEGLLPWCEPPGEIVAQMSVEGTVTLI